MLPSSEEQYFIASSPHLKHPSGISSNWSQSSFLMQSQPPASLKSKTHFLQSFNPPLSSVAQYLIASFPHLKHPSGISSVWSHSSSFMHSQPPASSKSETHLSHESSLSFSPGINKDCCLALFVFIF